MQRALAPGRLRAAGMRSGDASRTSYAWMLARAMTACANVAPEANSSPRSVESVSTVAAPEPARVAAGPSALEILIDVSGSMLAVTDPALIPRDLPNARRKDIADRTAIQLIQKRSEDSIGVTLFAKSTARIDIPRKDPAALIQAIRALPNREIDAGGSDLMLGLAEALEALTETNAASKQLVVLTDGDVNDETDEASDPVAVAKSQGVHIVVLQIGRIEDTKVVDGVDLFNVPHFVPMHVAINQVLLVRVTEGSGGERIIASDTASLDNAIERLGKPPEARLRDAGYRPQRCEAGQRRTSRRRPSHASCKLLR